MTHSDQVAVPETALVVFSGGQDSTVCLAWALDRFAHVETVGFDYGQRHAVEMAQRPLIRQGIQERFPNWTARLGDDHVIAVPSLKALGQTAMTDSIVIEMSDSGLPNTFVPGRNLVFFTLAAALAWRRGIGTLVGGMSQTDFSGYPDCRETTLQALAKTLSLGLDRTFEIETPLMHIDKAETWDLAHRLGGRDLVDVIVAETHTCYLGDRSIRHPWGAGCGTCPACELRARGWEIWSMSQSDKV
ncbi:MAG: 7-cyano-7-deazaguanine synthase QueC [Pseudomonadota bacterium]